MVQVTVAEAALKLRVSEQTIRRRLHRRDLPGIQVPSPQGFVWLVDLPDESTTVEVDDTLHKLVDNMQSQIDTLTQELEAKNKQIEQLHVLLQQAQAALPAPRRPWWRRWQRT
jgi:hypothetical protein